MTDNTCCLVLRLAGPLQSWGGRGQFNRRDTLDEPTKSGILGLLAAAQGLRRQDSIADLLGLSLGVRTDQPGSLLRDYHTVSDHRGRPLPSASVNARGVQKPTSPAKYTHVTHRFYLQDAVFVAAVSGPVDLLRALADALRNPAFPLALGRRSCPPTIPLLLTPDKTDRVDREAIWAGRTLDVLGQVPWQASDRHRSSRFRRDGRPPSVDLPVTVDDEDGSEVRVDVPHSFDPLHRGFNTRRVRQEWVRVPTGWPDTGQTDHDPFALLGW
ncbi:type I-E CRISPR-associated protein Cas5/CasD [Micromonospora phytophila]|uniref:type I-E CRISPR-associated protein Cas5/CasD n=1 Tax=Micromonospora phytophila TaxID=709888 RepID=UPI00202FED11|nr:type I-E CRISPR-associated protein Cas5/CasD [Micromonospora phytophila]MCM0674871.1 type I-E CRISPR-associated protein Cas5/CasD [Micromonospora phytophila]